MNNVKSYKLNNIKLKKTGRTLYIGTTVKTASQKEDKENFPLIISYIREN